jgi:hypothetical protein
MKRRVLLWVALVAVLGLVAWTAAAQEGDVAADEGAVVKPAETQADAPVAPEARVRQRRARAEGEEAGARRRPGRPTAKSLGYAITAPWAKDDPQLQQLVDKVIAGQEELIALQLNQLKILKEGVQERPTADKNRAALRFIWVEGTLADVQATQQALDEDAAALNTRLNELRPAREPGNRQREGQPREGVPDVPKEGAPQAAPEGAADAPREGG